MLCLSTRLGLRTQSYRVSASSRSLGRSSFSSSNLPAIFQMKGTTVYPFGVPSDDPSNAIFHSIDWTVGDSDCWAVLASSSSPAKSHLLSTILAQSRFYPRQSASHPILSSLPPVPRPVEEGGARDAAVSDIVQLVEFKTRLANAGAFDDYTARYYHIRDEDKLTVRQHLERSLPYGEEGTETRDAIFEAAKLLKMESFLEQPLVTLSNGQMRRASILGALLAKPELLILEEPFTGLDVASRAVLTSLLSTLHSARTPRIFLVLRPQDPLPPFVTHVALIGKEKGEVQLGSREEILAGKAAREMLEAGVRERGLTAQRQQARKRGGGSTDGKVLVDLKGVSVSYGARDVLVDVNWTIREGERWMLAGHNGSGKSTLLSIVLGDHPRSFTEDITLFGQPRDKMATSILKTHIGHISPEIFNAFPRKFGAAGLSAKEAIVTGFDSIFIYTAITPTQQTQLDSLLHDFAHPLLTPAFLDRLFATLSPGEQSLVLLLRALVKRAPLLVLDEPFAGMDSQTVEAAKAFLCHMLLPTQALVVISHFEEEVPESVSRSIKLDHGRVVEYL